MSELQWSAFEVWYVSAINTSKTKRSLKYAAEQLHLERRMIHDWYRAFAWKEIAAQKDAELDRKLEKVFIEKIVSTFEEAIERQRKMIQKVYDRFMELIPKIPANRLAVADLIKLMEFETNYVFNEQRGLPQGNNLGVVLHMMTPEQRTEFNAVVERSRDAGQLRFDADKPVGHPSRN